jgi:hypothetical protein
MKPPKQSDMFALEHSDLNEFLFAIVGTELNGMALTVLSLFARIDGDPWREAGRLASMPQTAASATLAQIIASMPMTVWSLSDATAIAARLVLLLPSQSSESASTEIQADQIRGGKGRSSYKAAVVPLICIALGAAFAFTTFIQMATPVVFSLR